MTPAHAGGRRVLVVEDDDDLRALVIELLEEEGCVVIAASDGQAFHAKAMAPESRFDLILSDIRLPRRDGLSVLADLRSAGRLEPVILMTGFGDDETRRRTTALGALLLEKPFDVRELQALVRRVLGGMTVS
jgi:DNA-binding response OmpR family regulator